VNMTDNLYTELFRGIPTDVGAQIHMTDANSLYAMSAAGQTSSNAFQKSPPDPNSGDGSHIWVAKYDLSQPSPPVISLSEPYQWGPPPVAGIVSRNQQ
jgi:hypothetical protein